MANVTNTKKLYNWELVSENLKIISTKSFNYDPMESKLELDGEDDLGVKVG